MAAMRATFPPAGNGRLPKYIQPSPAAGIAALPPLKQKNSLRVASGRYLVVSLRGERPFPQFARGRNGSGPACGSEMLRVGCQSDADIGRHKLQLSRLADEADQYRPAVSRRRYQSHPIVADIIPANFFKPCAASVSTHSRMVLRGCWRLSCIRISAAITSSGESASKRHKKASGVSATTLTFASSLRSKSPRFQVMIVTISALARLLSSRQHRRQREL